MGWLAFGAALDLDLWDLHFYIGASEWLWWSPDLLAQRLGRAEHGEVLSPPEIGDHLLAYIEDEADEQINRAIAAAKLRADTELLRKLRKIPSPPEPEHLGSTAGLLAEHLRANLANFERKRVAILNASCALRRALANGDLAAFGRVGDAPGLNDRLPSKPRDRVPRAVFDAPVTGACQGVFLWALSVDAAYDKETSA